jgi:2,4-dienoyl-CoA reductase-like NADH-dependent reductase (Old Yellow Enzyme family)
MKGARERVGNYPVLAKFSAYDNLKNGIRIDEALRIATMFQQAGIDALEVSCGANDGLSTMRPKEIPSDAIMEFLSPVNIKSEIVKSVLRKIIPLFTKKYEPLHNYNIAAAEKIKKQIDIPVIVVGGIRNINDINAIISGKKADYVSMSRPFIIEPDLMKKFREGKQDNSKCIDCCYCLFGLTKNPLRCYYGKVRG